MIPHPAPHIHPSYLPCAEQVSGSLKKPKDFRFVAAAVPRTGVMTHFPKMLFPKMTFPVQTLCMCYFTQ